MQTIEIWPDMIESGNAIGDDFAITYLRLVDDEAGVEVIAMLGAEAEQRLIDSLTAWAQNRTTRGQSN